MDKPLKLLSGNHEGQTQHNPMTTTLSYPINALLVLGENELLPRLESNLNNCANLTWTSTRSYTPKQENLDSKNTINLVLLVLPSDNDTAIKALENAAKFHSDIILLGQDTPQTVIRHAFKMGVSDFIPLDSSDEDFFQTLEVIANKLSETAELAPLVAVVNGKGGSGASFISTSLAEITTHHQDKELALLDTDLLFGTLSHMLALKPNYYITDALQALSELDEVALKSAMTKKKKLHLLAAEPFALLNSTQSVGLEHIDELIWKCRQHYHQVIVDLSRGPEYWNLEVLKNAQILIVVQQNVMSVRESKAIAEQLTKRLLIDKEQIHLVVNRYQHSGTGVSLKDIQDATGINSIFKVANDYKIASHCIDLGVDITKVGKRQKILKDLELISSHFLEPSLAVEKDKGFWSNLLGR